MRRSRITIFIASVVVIATACGGDDDVTADVSTAAPSTTITAAPSTTITAAPSTTTTVAPSTTAAEIPLPTTRGPADYAGFRLQSTACDAEPPPERVEMQFATPGDAGIDPASTPTAVIATSCGDITVELFPGVAPDTVNSFVYLAENGYFDGTASHRIVPGFVLQAGDPSATGFGGPGYVIADEFPQAGFRYERGILAMANAGPGTTGSQFFIMFEEAPLQPQFSVFGRVIDGFAVLDTIAALPLGVGPGGAQSTPLETLYLESVTISR